MPPNLSPHLEIEYVLNECVYSTRWVQIFFGEMARQTTLGNTWIATIDFQKLNPDLYELHEASNSLNPSFFKHEGVDGGKFLKVYSRRKEKT